MHRPDILLSISPYHLELIRQKDVIEKGDNHPYHYYAIVTNMSNAEMTNEWRIKAKCTTKNKV